VARTFIQLIGEVQTRLADGDGSGAGDVRWSLQEKKDALNRTYRDFCSVTEIMQQLVTWTQDSGAVYKPGSLVKVLRMLHDPTSATLGYSLSRVTLEELFAIDAAYATTAGDAVYYVWPYSIVDDEKKLLVSPVPSSAHTDLKCMCVVLPADMSANSDEAAIPTDLVDCLVDGACAYLLRKNGQALDLDLALTFERAYLEKRAQGKAMMQTAHHAGGAYVPYRVV
jgi:hypothetical protein